MTTLALAILIIIQAIRLAECKHRCSVMGRWNDDLWRMLGESERKRREMVEVIREQRMVIEILQREYREEQERVR